MRAADSRVARPDTRAEHGFLADVLAGLSSAPKTLPCKYLYDQHGSHLFDDITDLDEYYLTRAEVALLRAHAASIGEALRGAVDLVELGAGSSTKTRLLLDALPRLARYVPVDISAAHLRESATRLRTRYPDLAVQPVVADYTSTFRVDRATHATRRVVFFPGSTIGNFEPDDAVAFLRRTRTLAGVGGAVLVGVDLPKDARTIERAYDDSAGVTAAFNKNLLVRINRELDADFDVAHFAHAAPWDVTLSRVEMRLVSDCVQTVHIAGKTFHFAAGEPIVTEHCYKYSVDAFRALATSAGLVPGRVWLDPAERMSMHWLDC